MLGLFKSNPEKKLQNQYKRLMQENYELSKIDRKAADEKYAQAEEVLNELERLRNK